MISRNGGLTIRLGACQIEEGEVPEEGGERPWYIAKGTWKQEFTEEMYVPPPVKQSTTHRNSLYVLMVLARPTSPRLIDPSCPPVVSAMCRKVSAFALREWPILRETLQALPTYVDWNSVPQPTVAPVLGKRQFAPGRPM